MPDSSRSAQALAPIALACHTEGQGSPLVLLHGGMGSWTHWVRNIPVLRTHHTVHALDAPGCGDSPTVPEDLDPYAYIELVRAAVRKIAGEDRIGLVGFSFGGVVAAMLAASMPDTVERLALLAPGGFGVVPGRRLDLRKVPEGAGDAEQRSVLRHNLMVMMLARPQSADDATIDIQQANVARTRYDSRRFSLSGYTREALPRIAVPTLLIYGERDNLAWPSIEGRIEICRSLKPDLRVARIPDAGHWVQYEAAEDVNRLLLEFFG